MPTRRRVSYRGKLGRNALTAYSAGMLDGEGCIFWKNTPCVEVTNKHRPVLELFQSEWGGRVREKDRGVFCWSLYGSNAMHYLQEAAKYSVIKYPQIVALYLARQARNPKTREVFLKTLKRLKSVYTN